AGRNEQRLLDRRSDELAREVLAPLTDAQRERLVTAMADVERLLTVALVEITEIDPSDDDARESVRQYYAELDRRMEHGFDPTKARQVVDDEVRTPKGAFLIARLQGEPIGCGSLKFHGPEPTELKRLWVSPSVRGLGVGQRLLDALETRARQHRTN